MMLKILFICLAKIYEWHGMRSLYTDSLIERIDYGQDCSLADRKEAIWK